MLGRAEGVQREASHSDKEQLSVGNSPSFATSLKRKKRKKKREKREKRRKKREKREKRGEKERTREKKEKKMSRVNYYQSIL